MRLTDIRTVTKTLAGSSPYTQFLGSSSRRLILIVSTDGGGRLGIANRQIAFADCPPITWQLQWPGPYKREDYGPLVTDEIWVSNQAVAGQIVSIVEIFYVG